MPDRFAEASATSSSVDNARVLVTMGEVAQLERSAHCCAAKFRGVGKDAREIDRSHSEHRSKEGWAEGFWPWERWLGTKHQKLFSFSAIVELERALNNRSALRELLLSTWNVDMQQALRMCDDREVGNECVRCVVRVMGQSCRPLAKLVGQRVPCCWQVDVSVFNSCLPWPS